MVQRPVLPSRPRVSRDVSDLKADTPDVCNVSETSTESITGNREAPHHLLFVFLTIHTVHAFAVSIVFLGRPPPSMSVAQSYVLLALTRLDLGAGKSSYAFGTESFQSRFRQSSPSVAGHHSGQPCLTLRLRWKLLSVGSTGPLVFGHHRRERQGLFRRGHPRPLTSRG